MRPTGVVPLTAGQDVIVEVTPGDIVSVYADGDAWFAWQFDEGPRCTFFQSGAVLGDAKSTCLQVVPLGINRLLIRPAPAPAPKPATTACFGSQSFPC